MSIRDSSVKARTEVEPVETGYDYVVVGGGTAGSVIAARLAENAALTVCLIEAGLSDAGNADVLAVTNLPPGTELDYEA